MGGGGGGGGGGGVVGGVAYVHNMDNSAPLVSAHHSASQKPQNRSRRQCSEATFTCAD